MDAKVPMKEQIHHSVTQNWTAPFRVISSKVHLYEVVVAARSVNQRTLICGLAISFIYFPIARSDAKALTQLFSAPSMTQGDLSQMLLKWETFPVSRRAVLSCGVYSAPSLMTHWPSIILRIVQPRLHMFPSVCRKCFGRWCLPVFCHVFVFWFIDLFFVCFSAEIFFAFQTAPLFRNLSYLFLNLFLLGSTVRVAHLWASHCPGHLFWQRVSERAAW